MYPNVEIIRDRLPKLKRYGVHKIGNVNILGNDEFIWFCGQLSNRQHEGEITEECLGIQADEIRRLYDVDQELRPDVEIVIGGKVIPLEHESCETLNLRQIKEKFERYGDNTVLWTCKTQRYLDKLASHATSDKHLFTLFSLAIEDFHGPIWVDRHSKLFSFPVSDSMSVQLSEQ